MSALVTPYRPAPSAAADGFRPLLHAEWTKFRTVRGWVICLGAAVVVLILVGLLGTGGAHGEGHPQRMATGPGGIAVNDNFYFAHRALNGDGTITVALTSMAVRAEERPDPAPADAGGTPSVPLSDAAKVPWSKVGLMVKKNLGRGSPYAAIMLTGGHGVRMQDNFVHDTAGPAVASSAVSAGSPRWLRLSRTGDRITGSTSADGAHWVTVGTARLDGLGARAEVGLFATAPEVISGGDGRGGVAMSPAVAVGGFGPVSLSDRWAPQVPASAALAWGTAVQVGGDSGFSGSYSQFLRPQLTATDSGITLTGAGDVAPVAGGTGPGFLLENLLVGAFAGLILITVLGAVFITSEFRSGMIRTTLAARPRREQVLAAKAVVLAAVVFVAGLVGAVLAIAIGAPRARRHGLPVIPVPPATELRVIVGTAALLAVAAVFALAVGVLVRRSAAAATTVIAVLILPYVLALSAVLPLGPSDWLLRVTPAAGFAIQQSLHRYEQVAGNYIPASGYYPMPYWAGFGVLCGYTAIALIAAAVRLRRRDA